MSSIDDATEAAFGWAAQQGQPQPGGVNPGMVVGPRMAEMVQTFGANLREGRARLILGEASAAAGAAA